VAPERGRRRGRRGWKALAIAGALVAVIAIIVALNPTGRYLARAGWSEARILAGRRSIRAMIADPATPDSTRQKLRLVLAARDFARDSLHLKVGQSFATYVKLPHDTLVLVLSGAYRDRLQEVTWWYPIVGDVPYKGYFNPTDAVRAARSLSDLGFDVSLRPSPAFSTLGWFSDPLVSTSLGEDSLDLVNTVIHELTHSTYYGSSQVAFNESFANFAGSRGAAAFFRMRGDTAAAEEVEARWADEKTLGAFWGWTYATLDSAFRAHPGADSAARNARLSARDAVFHRVRDSLTTSLPLKIYTIPAAVLARARLDNAALLARRVYLTDLEDFDTIYQWYWMFGRAPTAAPRSSSTSSLARAIGQIIELARSEPDHPFDALRRFASTK
jgi:predicted aminopeptidase